MQVAVPVSRRMGSGLYSAMPSWLSIPSTGLEGEITSEMTTVSLIAFSLSRSLGVPVADETGLKAQYNFTLKMVS